MRQCEELVLPHVLAIYEPIDEARVEQIGTGILVAHDNRHFLVTARHVLLGTANAGDLAIVVDDRLRQIADLANPNVYGSPEFDLAAVVIDGFPAERGLHAAHFAPTSDPPPFITICGYLARDFRRSTREGRLEPAPYIYSGRSVAAAQGLVGLEYPINRNRSTTSGRRVMAPVPRGLSGGAMLDSLALHEGIVRIVGIFTDKPGHKGIAFGEVSVKALALLDVVTERLSSRGDGD